MTVALEKFVKQLADSGIIAPGKLENFIPPKAHPKDADELARELIKHSQLTKFQAQHVLQGKAKALFLGNYTVLDKIGAGGMGQVFKAEHRRMKRIVALKMLPPSVNKDAAAAARFQREVEAAARLRHPNIVAADDADEANGAHFLVMEYVEGKDLSALVKQNGPFAVDKAVNYILQTARGLEFAHSEGVIHRDIKPANLLLDKKGTVKILDMGLARIDAQDGDVAAQAELTGSGAVMGTIDYMAPEQALSTHHADARADIYSLGCSLHYLLTGKAVYGGNTLMAKMLAHRESPIPSLRDGRTAVPEQVEAIFRKMVAKRVEDRYQTMSQLVADLERCCAGRDVSINTQQSLGTAGESINLTLLKNTPVRPILISPPKPASAAPTVEPSSSKKRKNKKKNKRNNHFPMLIGGGLLAVVLLAAVIFKMRTKDGTLVVEINQPNAVVQVLSAEGKVEISQSGGKGAISISVDPGKHRLRVEKDGYKYFARDFEVQSRGQTTIKATLERLGLAAANGGKLVVSGRKPALTATPDFALEFDGAKSYVGTPIRYDGSYPLTVEARVTQHSKNDKIQFIVGDSENGGINLSMQHGLFEMVYRATSTTAEWGPLVSASSKALAMPHRIYYVAGVFNRNEVRLFVDGVLQSTAAGQPLKVSPMPMLIGANPGGPIPDPPFVTSAREVFDGSIDEVRISKVARYQGNYTPVPRFEPDADTLALYHFDEGRGDVAYDASDNGITAKIVGAKWVPADSLGGAMSGQGALPSTAATAKPGTTLNDPAFQQWMKAVAALPAEKQLAAVAKKLMELNPGFDGKLTGPYGHGTPGISNGVVTAFGFLTNNVADIAPVRALAGLEQLGCAGSERDQQGKLSDISPLAGMPLTKLLCQNNPISNLSSLRGAKLTYLNCAHTQISDLSPLAGMPLTTLACSRTKISDLTALEGMPLWSLNFYDTQVSDLAPLKGMPLATLDFTRTQVSDLSALEGMPLTKLTCGGTRVSDLSPLRGMILTEVRITPKNITKGMDLLRQIKSLTSIGVGWEGKDQLRPDEFWKRYDAGEFGKPITTFNELAFRQWMKTVASLPAKKQVDAVAKKLQELNPGFGGAVRGFDDANPSPRIEQGVVTEIGFVADNVTDISPVRALTGLTHLDCRGSTTGKGKLSDLSPLEGMKLSGLIFSFTQVSGLDPLKGMPLADLRCSSTQVSDLSLLPGMPLRALYCYGSQVIDLSPLQGMHLTEIHFTPNKITKGLDIIRHMQSLKSLGTSGKSNLPPAEFWKKYDAGVFGKPI